MKTLKLLFAAILLTAAVDAQTKPKSKPVAKKVTQPATEPPKPQTPCNVENAGRYAKGFANKMYYTRPCYGDKRQGLNVNIIDWKGIQSDDGVWYYFVKLELAWQEGTGGWGDWKNVRYKGTMVTDQFGCNTLYLIDEKEEFSIMGLSKRARKLTPEQQGVLSQKDEWTAKVQYYWEPEGCLD